ncbi:MAG TPA: hypothetical protein VGB30_06080 [bacterium]
MIFRLLAMFGIVFALFGFATAPGFISRATRSRINPIHDLDTRDSELPWDLSGFVPVGIHDRRTHIPIRQWTMLPDFKRVK